MSSRRLLTTVTTLQVLFAVMLAASPAYAAAPTPPPPAGQDNGRWVGPIAFLVFVAVVAGMLFIANAYRKNNQDQDR